MAAFVWASSASGKETRSAFCPISGRAATTPTAETVSEPPSSPSSEICEPGSLGGSNCSSSFVTTAGSAGGTSAGATRIPPAMRKLPGTEIASPRTPGLVADALTPGVSDRQEPRSPRPNGTGRHTALARETLEASVTDDELGRGGGAFETAIDLTSSETEPEKFVLASAHCGLRSVRRHDVPQAPCSQP